MYFVYQDLVVRHIFLHQDMGAPSSVPQKPEKREKGHVSTAVSYGSVLTPETTIVSKILVMANQVTSNYQLMVHLEQ